MSSSASLVLISFILEKDSCYAYMVVNSMSYGSLFIFNNSPQPFRNLGRSWKPKRLRSLLQNLHQMQRLPRARLKVRLRAGLRPNLIRRRFLIRMMVKLRQLQNQNVGGQRHDEAIGERSNMWLEVTIARFYAAHVRNACIYNFT